MGWLFHATLVLAAGLDTFAAQQAAAPRVIEARAAAQAGIERAFASAQVPYPPRALYVRIFKLESVVEVWAGGDANLKHIADYPVCASSGELGPKRKRGDLQVPEGFYRITIFNTTSNYYLALGIDYPNASDRALGDHRDPGGDIYIHGECVTIGCVPLAADIKPVYLIALDTYLHNHGAAMPVHIFPRRLDATGMQSLRAAAADSPGLVRFWENLLPAYQIFETTHRLPATSVGADGYYKVTAR